MAGITAIILTLNEEIHIARCLRSLSGVVEQLIVIDSGSTDRTVEISKSFGAEVYVNKWKNYSSQFNWGLDHAAITGDWCLRIDADEILDAELRAEIVMILQRGVDPSISGFLLKRSMIFMGRLIRWGGCGGLEMLRLFRTGMGRCEERWMDEHIVLSSGASIALGGMLIDENINNIGWWIDKHNSYATREAVDLLIINGYFRANTLQSAGSRSNAGAGRKRWVKENIYSALPLGFRALSYFIYRFIFKLGILDGFRGFAFHFLQGLWYRFLVDLKVLEMERCIKKSSLSPSEAIEVEYGVRLMPKDDERLV